MRTNADVGHGLYLIPPFLVGWRNFFGELSMVERKTSARSEYFAF